MFDVRPRDGGVVSLVGELDLAEADVLTRWVGANVDGQRDIVLDCSALTFIDSSGIRAILTFASRTPRRVIMRAPLPNVRKVLEVTGVNEAVGVMVEP